MATVTGMTASATTAALALKADLVSGKVPDAQLSAIAVKRGDFFINAKDYGAVGDGVAHDDAALLAAIAAIPAGGGVVYLPAGSYLLTGSAPLNLSIVGTTLRGAGPEATKLILGSTYSSSSMVGILTDDCKVEELSFVGGISTISSNPFARAIGVSGARTKIVNCSFRYINYYPIEMFAGGSVDGSVFSKLNMTLCAGGIHLQGVAGTNANVFISDVEIFNCGTSSGSAANTTGVYLEDCSGVFITNLRIWMSNGTGYGLNIYGQSNDVIIKNLDVNGATSLYNVLIGDSFTGGRFAQNVQINGAVIQNGGIGIRVTGSAKHLYFQALRVIGAKTHGISIEGTGANIHLDKVQFVTSGAGATGTNYEVNWSGSATGSVNACRFTTAIVTVGTAGVQKSINVGAGQSVRCLDAFFSGTGQASTNWFTNVPSAVMETSSGMFDFIAPVKFSDIRVAESTNGRAGVATLVAGTVTVANTSITANTRVYIGMKTPGGTPGASFANTVTVGTSFVIKSTSATDTSIVSWELHEAA